MLIGHLLLLILALPAETGPSVTEALLCDDAPMAGSVFPACKGVAKSSLTASAGTMHRTSQPSPWDDEIEIPDEPEDDEPDDPGEALNSKAPTRGHFAACRTFGPFEVAVTPCAFRPTVAIHTSEPSHSLTALCRLLF